MDRFLMYSPEGFLTLARKYLKTKVTEGTLNDVRYVSEYSFRNTNRRMVYQEVEEAVFLWIAENFGTPVHNRVGFPDFYVQTLSALLGFEIKSIGSQTISNNRLREIVSKVRIEVGAQSQYAFHLVLVGDDRDDCDLIADMLGGC